MEPQQPNTTPPPAWTQYDPQNAQTPISSALQPQTFMERQSAMYRHDLTRWARRLNMPVPAVVAVMVCLVLCSCAFWGAVALNAFTAPSRADAARVAATQTASVPTVTPGPTATLPPPTPTLTLQQQYMGLVMGQTGNDSGVTVSINATRQIVTVTDNIGTPLDASSAVTTIKERAYNILHALYTQSSQPPAYVILKVLGPATDAYGNNLPNDLYGRIELSAATAQKFNWSGLTPDTAWQVYDDLYLAPYLQGA